MSGTKEARFLSGADIGGYILDSTGQRWRVAEVHHYPTGVSVDIHHKDTGNWATSEPEDEVEYGISDIVTVEEDAA